MAVVVAMAAAARRGLVLLSHTAGVTSGARGKEPLQRVASRAPTGIETLICTAGVSAGAAQQAIEVALQDASSSKSRTILDLSWHLFLWSIALRDARKRTSAAQRGAIRGLVSSRSASHLSPRKQGTLRFHP